VAQAIAVFVDWFILVSSFAVIGERYNYFGSCLKMIIGKPLYNEADHKNKTG